MLLFYLTDCILKINKHNLFSALFGTNLDYKIADMEMGEQITNGRICPFIKNPDIDCYCTKLDSRYTEAMIIFCSGVYERCSVYKRKSATLKLSEDTSSP